MLFVPMAVMTDVLVVVTGTVITHVPEIVLPLVLMIVPVVLVVVLDVPELVRAVVLVTAIQAVILAVMAAIQPVLDPALVLVILLALLLAPMTALADKRGAELQRKYAALANEMEKEYIPEYLEGHQYSWIIPNNSDEMTITIKCNCEIPELEGIA